MQDNFVQSQGDQIIIDKDQLITYALIAAAVILLIGVLMFLAKRRKKSFIKTVPTNLKDVE